jgi:hypothetical protein
MLEYETPVLQTLFIVYFCQCCQRKKEKKVQLPTGISKSTVHTVGNQTSARDWPNQSLFWCDLQKGGQDSFERSLTPKIKFHKRSAIL